MRFIRRKPEQRLRMLSSCQTAAHVTKAPEELGRVGPGRFGRAITSTPQMRLALAVTGAGLALLSDKNCGIGALPSLPDILPVGF